MRSRTATRREDRIAGEKRDFTAFMRDTEPRVRRALVAGFGPEVGSDATAEAMAIAWERWEAVASCDNPAGYVFGIGRNVARRRVGERPRYPDPPPHSEPWIEPGLPAAIEELSEHQRTAVLLVHGFHWTYREAAEFLDVSASTVQAHVDRGMRKLRAALGVEP